jgi:hypothetical protein
VDIWTLAGHREHMFRTVLLVFVLAQAPRTVPAQLSARQARVEIVAPAAPRPVVAAGKRVLVYELHVTNLGRGPLAFREIDVWDGGGKAASLATYRDTALAHALAPGGVTITDTDTARWSVYLDYAAMYRTPTARHVAPRRSTRTTAASPKSMGMSITNDTLPRPRAAKLDGVKNNMTLALS